MSVTPADPLGRVRKLLVQAAHGLAAAEVPSFEHPAASRRSWLAGFTEAIRTRLTAAEPDAAAGGLAGTGRRQGYAAGRTAGLGGTGLPA